MKGKEAGLQKKEGFRRDFTQLPGLRRKLSLLLADPAVLLKFAVIGFFLLFWPLSLFIANSVGDFIKYFFPAVLVGLSVLLLYRKNNFNLLPLLAIPLIEHKLALFPFLVAFSIFVFNRNSRNFAFVLISLFVFLLAWKDFWNDSVFKRDYRAQEEIVSRTYLYPNVATARLFQNKVRIYINKFNSNFFALTDSNNYFFNFHPREIVVDNQNLSKYPFSSIVFALFGFYYLRKHYLGKYILILLGSLLLSLSLISSFDRTDFILWTPFSLVLIHGFTSFQNSRIRFQYLFYAFYFAFSLHELIRIFLR